MTTMPSIQALTVADRATIDFALDAACRSVGLAPAIDLSTHLAALCRDESSIERGLDHAAADLAQRSLTELADLLRVGTARFHLLNKAEQLAIITVNRHRELASTPESPRPESIDAAFAALKSSGLDAHAARALLPRLDIEPTLTAHPTEARRRTILEKQTDIAACVLRLRDPALTERERSDTKDKLERVIAMMLMTDDVRIKRLNVPDEVRNGLYFLTTTIWHTIPRLYRDIVWAARRTFGQDSADIVAAELPAILRYRTWIGGDRDGNPNVTAEVTARTLETMRAAAIDLWHDELLRLRHILSVSTRRVSLGNEIYEAIERDAAYLDDSAHLDQRATEPLRIRLSQMRARIARDPSYNTQALLEDLLILRRALHTAGLARIADEGALADSIIRARVFGLHLATMDIRQHSRVHASALAELLTLAGLRTPSQDLPEPQLCDLIKCELTNPRPLVAPHTALTPDTAELLAVLGVIHQAIEREPSSIRAYVISMTHQKSDLLGLLLLMKEAGLVVPQNSRTHHPTPMQSRIQVVPLFETIDDLQRAPGLMDELLADPVYRNHLQAVAHAQSMPHIEQEIMLGYSDSNKDGGFLMANVSLHTAQHAIATVVASHGIALRYFHGRGGTIGRGGGRAGRAILAAPAAARSGSLRFTEQGEVITFRYAMPDMARRHLEQIVSAALIAQSGSQTTPTDDPIASILLSLAQHAQTAYRELIDHPKFWPWFVAASPVEHIGSLPIASRPVSRATGSALTFDTLRAIPWVFSWVQMRGLVPGFFGLGTAFAAATNSQLDLLATHTPTHSFASTIFENASQELARTRLPILRRYAALAPDGHTMFSRLENEYLAATQGLARIRGTSDLMAHSPVIGRSIIDRNPWTDVLNLTQIELLKRWHNAHSDPEREAIRPILQASINAIAAAMQSTG